MSSFKVNSAAVSELAAQLQDAHRDVGQAQLYAKAHGTFGFHEAGAIGMLFGRHAGLMEQLNELLGHVSAITDESSAALSRMAEDYNLSDQQSAARVDATYAETPRPVVTRD